MSLKAIVPDTIRECSIIVDPKATTCVPEQYLSKFGNKSLDELKKETGCDTEQCVIRSDLAQDSLGQTLADQIDKTFFKPVGPTDTSLLSNFDIDGILQQISIKFTKFYHVPYGMADWYKHPSMPLCNVNAPVLHARNYDTIACVINSDVTTGRGKHWMALFVDMRQSPHTIEFFNSSGNAPKETYIKWMDTVKSQFDDVNQPSTIVPIHKIRHQHTKSECGVYALFYIYARLMGIPYSFFQQHKITDVMCFHFRQHLFRPYNPQHKFDKHFNFKQFSEIAKIMWEPGEKPHDITHAEQTNAQNQSSVEPASIIPNYTQPKLQDGGRQTNKRRHNNNSTSVTGGNDTDEDSDASSADDSSDDDSSIIINTHKTLAKGTANSFTVVAKQNSKCNKYTVKIECDKEYDSDTDSDSETEDQFIIIRTERLDADDDLIITVEPRNDFELDPTDNIKYQTDTFDIIGGSDKDYDWQ